MIEITRIQQAAEYLRAAQRVVVFTGAGVSRESGVPTFRDALTGLWANYDPHKLATVAGFRANPKLVWDWYAERQAQLRTVTPNAGHDAIAALEKSIPSVTVMTQNIDGLHERAGSTDVIALHGDITRYKCLADCQGNPTEVVIEDLVWDREQGPPACPHCGAWVRPAVVWFGEMLPPGTFERAVALTEAADVLLVVGTSGEVQPAASLPSIARQHGAKVIEVNPHPSALSRRAHVFLQGPSGEVLPQIVAAMHATE